MPDNPQTTEKPNLYPLAEMVVQAIPVSVDMRDYRPAIKVVDGFLMEAFNRGAQWMKDQS